MVIPLLLLELLFFYFNVCPESERAQRLACTFPLVNSCARNTADRPYFWRCLRYIAQNLSRLSTHLLEFFSCPSLVFSAATIPQPRALVLSGAPDVPETYNSVMNAIFSAQKTGVLVDCAVLGESSTFLQQAAYLTGETVSVIPFFAALELRTVVVGVVLIAGVASLIGGCRVRPTTPLSLVLSVGPRPWRHRR